MVIGL